jgi:hypothetical protein
MLEEKFTLCFKILYINICSIISLVPLHNFFETVGYYNLFRRSLLQLKNLDLFPCRVVTKLIHTAYNFNVDLLFLIWPFFLKMHIPIKKRKSWRMSNG